MKKKQRGAESQVNPSKKTLFRIILILIPVGLFVFLELVLRIFGYADDLDFVSKIDRNGKEYYTINQLVGKRYFNKDRMYYRKGSHDYFEVDKSSNTIRVFCLGASTMAGFPYEYNAIPSEFLRDRLKAGFPGKNIEVINTAIAATNSFTVDEFANELVKYKPDLFIIYMGQNEYYGVYGVGSTISVGKNRALIKTYLWLQNFKTFVLLKNIINSVSGWFGSENEQENKVLMEEMANTSIRYDSDDYRTGVNTFRENYREVINTARENNIPVLISSLVRNEKSLAPFVSFHSAGLSDTVKTLSENIFKQGVDSLNRRNYSAAEDLFSKALAIDSMPANFHYALARCYEESGRYNDAGSQYSVAADLDGLRFRAPSVFNKIIFNLGDEYKVPVADVRTLFKNNSANGIIGSELLVDHVHPNIKGYFLLAKAWYRSIKEHQLLGSLQETEASDSTIWAISAVTELDSLIGAIKIMELKSRPPFTKSDSVFTYKPQTVPEQLAYEYAVDHKSSWAASHLNLAKYYLTLGYYAKSLVELKAILVSDEDNPMVLKLAGDMSLQLGKFEQAEAYYLKANRFEANQYIEYKLGKTELLLGKPDMAIQFLNSSLERNQQSNDKFTPGEMQDVYSSLAEAYNKNNQPEKAREVIQKLFK
jgi:tetratricopeptide (TPR) repeat protein